MSRYEIIPFRYFVSFYGMMAPFQGYITHDWQLVAEGKQPGSEWTVIDLNPYLPFARGEKVMRGGLVSFRLQGKEFRQKQYEKLARRILELEKKRGTAYTDIRLSLHYWPASPMGYEALRKEVFLEKEVILTLEK